jgi:hypothetical protein
METKSSGIMEKQFTAGLSLTMEAAKMPPFFQFLQHGFMERVQTGCTIKTLLCDQFGVSPEYVERQISTVFMDGKPVDDVDSAVIKDGSVLAFSAAMPGLVGTTLRRGGHLAAFRSRITHREEEKVLSLHDGVVVLKLFNQLVKELGPSFLSRGIWVRGDALENFLESRPDDFWAGFRKAEVDGKEADLKAVLKIKWSEKREPVLLKVFEVY